MTAIQMEECCDSGRGFRSVMGLTWSLLNLYKQVGHTSLTSFKVCTLKNVCHRHSCPCLPSTATTLYFHGRVQGAAPSDLYERGRHAFVGSGTAAR